MIKGTPLYMYLTKKCNRALNALPLDPLFENKTIT